MLYFFIFAQISGMKIIADSHIPYLKGVLEPFFDVKYIPGHLISRENTKNADILIVRTRTQCNKQLLEGSKVKYIASATIGFDHIDVDFCREHGIVWQTAPGCNAAAVQQWVGAAIVKWLQVRSISPRGLTLGVVGVGNVGSKVATLGSALGMNVVCCDPPRAENEGLPDFVQLKQLLESSDIISFHVPLTKTGKYPTHHLLNSSNIALCKSNCFFINTSRGGVIDENDLLHFLGSNPNADIASDVWENEPNLNTTLASRSIVATPHIAGYSLEGKVMATKMVVDSISKHFNLGIEPWWPIPNPLAEKKIIGNAHSILEVIGKSYSIENDDIRKISGGFEDYRNTYNYRRDFTGHRVLEYNHEVEKLVKLGFQVG